MRLSPMRKTWAGVMTILHADAALGADASLLIPKVEFASCYVYSPGGFCATSERSRFLLALLKAGDESLIVKCVSRVRKEAAELPLFAGFFTPHDVLIPVPRSTPGSRGSIWVAECLAAAFLRQGLGREVWLGLQRVRAVRKSGTAMAGRRPTVLSHYESFAADQRGQTPERVILVDDVITKGRTILAAASRVREALPGTQIRAFAMVRTMGLIPNVVQLLNPCRGVIKWRAGDAHRNP
jgi:predicted amidophosphoribosyltransferase